METIGAYEAKTHLPRLLADVARGESITITKHGRAVARLVPAKDGEGTGADIVAALREARVGVRRGRSSVRQMIEEGRR
ncbi:type II toxin-antitoxin system Phd/YefM family antitoxin [Kribbia dieselivorans]|uniref:type II toxin-antitoxin system Phd/YefM family antitoxin n=1 Tax=Kribbia dieselivorans TaxID=331526 RepID=UPI0008382DBB|nr:type II toxin-antitoxin system prevent-host-death family antitoxin [Kribbia dieselivorans]